MLLLPVVNWAAERSATDYAYLYRLSYLMLILSLSLWAASLNHWLPSQHGLMVP